MKKSLSIAIGASLLVHSAFLVCITCLRFAGVTPLGDGMMSVELVEGGSPKKGGPDISGTTPAGTGRPAAARNAGIPEGGENGGKTAENAGGGLGAGSLKGDPVLSRIRDRIERSKYYPPEAKRRKVEGRSVVLFEINRDGTIKNATIKESSGIRTLDEAALETLRRAEPLPYFGSPITISIKYALK